MGHSRRETAIPSPEGTADPARAFLADWWLPLVLTILAWGIVGTSAWAHSWYPSRCCSDKDCQQLTAEDYSLEGTVYRIHETGETFDTGDARMSPDTYVHRCRMNQRDARTRVVDKKPCFWVPQAGT